MICSMDAMLRAWLNGGRSDGGGRSDCWRWEIRRVGILKDGYRRKELSMGLGN